MSYHVTQLAMIRHRPSWSKPQLTPKGCDIGRPQVAGWQTTVVGEVLQTDTGGQSDT